MKSIRRSRRQSKGLMKYSGFHVNSKPQARKYGEREREKGRESGKDKEAERKEKGARERKRKEKRARERKRRNSMRGRRNAGSRFCEC